MTTEFGGCGIEPPNGSYSEMVTKRYVTNHPLTWDAFPTMKSCIVIVSYVTPISRVEMHSVDEWVRDYLFLQRIKLVNYVAGLV
jgi:hypothetical protein